jgi:hypothetical protein
MISPLLFMLAWQASATAACAPDANTNSLGFVVVTHAVSIRCASDGASPEMSYNVPESYPAKGALTEIAANLRQRGWDPLPEDFLNPGIPSSHLTGWSSFIDGTVEPHDHVRQWLAQWRNPHHDVVVYAVVYRWPVTTSDPQLDTARVMMRYLPCSLVREGRKALGVSEPTDSECPENPR